MGVAFHRVQEAGPDDDRVSAGRERRFEVRAYRDAAVARIVAYDIATGRRGVVAQFDRDLFTSGRPDFITRDEESSGIISADQQLGNGWFLFDAQGHAPAANPEYVEKGQLLAMRVDSFKRIYR
jgi:hypothetical protein